MSLEYFKGINYENESFDFLKYILTSEFRFNIILNLYESEKNLEELRDDLNKTSTNILRALKELIDIELVEKIEKTYYLTSSGYLTAINIKNLIDNWFAVDSNVEFWEKHYIDPLASKFLIRMDMWDKAKVIKSDNVDFAKPLNYFAEYVSKAKEISIIAPVFSKMRLNIVLDSLIKNNSTLELITNKTILDLIYKADNEDIFYYLCNEGKIKVHLTEDILQVFFTSCDNFASLQLFFDEKFFDDSTMIFTDDPTGILKANTFINYYKNRISRK